MPRISNQELIHLNTEHWAIASYHPSAVALAKGVAARLVSTRAKLIYTQIEAATGVPWWVVALLHEREASQRWDRQLGQGDPLNAVSRHVPKGRGPFSTFTAGAIDALMNCAPYLGRWKDWSPGGALTGAELYNGVGYENYHHMASPYVWGGSNIYHTGKYVADGKFDATFTDPQLGCAVILKEMMELDSSIQFAVPAPVEADVPLPEDRPVRADENDDAQDQPPPVSSEPAPVASPVAAQAQSSAAKIDAVQDIQNVPPGWLSQSVKERAEGAIMTADPKSLFKSKIGWGTVGLSATSTTSIASQAPSTVWDTAWAALHSAWTYMIVLNIALVAFILYRYWRDHGRGSV